MTQILTNSNDNILVNSIENILQTDYRISNISGLTLWLEPSNKNIKLDINNKVIQWNDISGNMNHAIQINDLYKPSYEQGIINGFNSIRFNSNKYLSTMISLNIFTIFTIYKSTNSLYIYEYGNDTNNSTGFYLSGDINSISVNKSGNKSYRKYATNWGNTNMFKIITHTYDGSNTGHTFKVNGVNKTLSNTYTSDPGNLNITQNLNIGSKVNGISGINGYITEYIVFNRILSSVEYNIIIGYLKTKYNIS